MITNINLLIRVTFEHPCMHTHAPTHSKQNIINSVPLWTVEKIREQIITI